MVQMITGRGNPGAMVVFRRVPTEMILKRGDSEMSAVELSWMQTPHPSHTEEKE